MGDRKAAMEFYQQGHRAAQDSSNPDHLKVAYQLHGSACMVDPTWADGFYQAGNNASDLQGVRAAIACWRRALECNPDQPLRARILTNLGWRLHGLGKIEEAFRLAREAVQLDPNLHLGWVNLSCIHQTLNNPSESARCARLGYSLKPDDPLAEQQLAFALLFNRELEEGFRRHEIRFKYKLKSYLQFPYPKWDGEADKTVYLVADQGLGDTLSFARFVPEMCRRVRYVHAVVQPELMRLFANAFVGIQNLNLMPMPCPFPAADAWSTFMGIPAALKLGDQEIRQAPDIPIPAFHQTRNWIVPDRKLHIGIAWRGSAQNDINVHRSIPLEMFAELYRVPGVQLYSLQVGEHAKDMHDQGYFPVIRDLTRNVCDVADTMGLLQHLDMVITCESALGHICAAVGKECWIPYSMLGKDYRIGLKGVDRLWSPKHRIFNQGMDCRWEPVFEEIIEALREKIDAKSGGAVGAGGKEVRLAGAQVGR